MNSSSRKASWSVPQPEVKAGDPIKVDWGRFGGRRVIKVDHVSKNGIVYACRKTDWGWTKPRRIYWWRISGFWSIHGPY